MRESTTYQAILEEGRQEGAVNEGRKFLVLLGEPRLGKPSAAIRKALESISDLNRLEAMGVRLLQAESWQDLLQESTPAPSPRRRRHNSEDNLMRIVMMGTGVFAEPTFEALLTRPGLVAGAFTQPDRAVGQERGSTRQTGRGMKTIALEHGIAVFQPESINTPEGLTQLRSLSPDLLVVAAYGQILSNEVLGIPPHGAINVHASLLPKYRGAAPIAWAIYHGETRTGVTIFRISTGVDTGDMLAQESVEIGPEQTAGDVEVVLAPLGARMALDVVDQIMAGTPLVGVKQDKSLATRAPKLTKENGLIDWSRRGDRVCCQIRAMHPWPTAYTFWHRTGQPPLRLIVHRATTGSGDPEETPVSGTIFPGSISTLCVAAGENTVVEIHELQPAGKKRMSAAEFLRGRKPLPGDRLGPEAP